MSGQFLLGPNGQPMPVNQGMEEHPTAEYRLAKRPDDSISLQRAFLRRKGIGAEVVWADVGVALVDQDGRDIPQPEEARNAMT